MKEELVEYTRKIIDKAVGEGFSEVAVLLLNEKRSMVKIANSEPSVVQHWSTISVGLYLVKDKRIIVARVEPSSIEQIDKPVKELLKIASRVEESPLYAPLPRPEKEPKPLENLVDEGIVKAIENPVELAERVVEVAHREKVDRVAGTIDLAYTTRVLATTAIGNVLVEDSTRLQAYLRAFASEDGSGQWALGSTRLDTRRLEEMASIAARYAVESRNRVEIEPGVYDVVLSPMVFGNLLNYVANMASAFMMFMGMSFFVNYKPGTSIASTRFTLLDDPLNKELPRATGFDDEGVPTKTKPIIENGVFKTVLHNSKTASKMNTETTGNAGWIMPTPWNLVVRAGDYKLDELIGEVKKGILVTNNWYTRLQNYVEGLFSTITRDALFLIEDGKITKPVNKLRIADKLPRILSNIDGLGRDLYDIQWWEVRIPTRLPYVLVRQVHTSKHTV